jgi:hypothetical protein
MIISTLVISDIDQFIEMQDFWDQGVRANVDGPFLFSPSIVEVRNLVRSWCSIRFYGFLIQE